jgi:hypothetical protein
MLHDTALADESCDQRQHDAADSTSVIPRSLSDRCALKSQESYLPCLIVLPSTFQIDYFILHHTALRVVVVEEEVVDVRSTGRISLV